jgi:uncharacterized protein YdeI (YjbR/CyaY-like superfamily)
MARKKVPVECPDFVLEALDAAPGAREQFYALEVRQQEQYIMWILMTETEEEQTARIQKMIHMLLELDEPSDDSEEETDEE